jgi:hypothetical protein
MVFARSLSLRRLPKEVQVKLLRVSESLARHLQGTDLHPRSPIVQLVPFQPQANRLIRCRGESRAPNKFGRLFALFVRELALPYFRYPCLDLSLGQQLNDLLDGFDVDHIVGDIDCSSDPYLLPFIRAYFVLIVEHVFRFGN